MDIQEAIEIVLGTVPEGHVFDTHYVVDELLAKEEYSDAYLVFAAKYADSNRPTLTAHQQLGHLVNRFKGGLIERMNDDSWSMNFHRRASKCASWRRV